MARHSKVGLDYFPLDADFFENDKIALLSAEFGLEAEIIVLRLFCKIYKNGYYYKWTPDECLLLSKKLCNSLGVAFVEKIVKRCLKRSIFDESIFNSFGILTSCGIQKRFLLAVERRKHVEIAHEYWLIDVPESKKNQEISITSISKKTLKTPTNKKSINSINTNIEPINASINTQSKPKQTKPKKTKQNILPNGVCEVASQAASPHTHFLRTGSFKNVVLTNENYCSLQQKLGQPPDALIEEFSTYLAGISVAKSKQYANHYAALCKWALKKTQPKESEKANEIKNTKKIERDFMQRVYDPGALESLFD